MQKQLKTNPTGNSPRNLKKRIHVAVWLSFNFFGYLPIENSFIILNKAAGWQKFARFMEQNVLENWLWKSGNLIHNRFIFEFLKNNSWLFSNSSLRYLKIKFSEPLFFWKLFLVPEILQFVFLTAFEYFDFMYLAKLYFRYSP